MYGLFVSVAGVRHREADQAASRIQAELIEQMNPVRVDRSTADVQPIRDLQG